MLRIALLFLLAGCFPELLNGQGNDKMHALLDYPNSTAEAISNGRKILYERFLRKDSAAVREILDHLVTKVEDETQTAVLPDEYFLFNYWLQRYDRVISFAIKFDSILNQIKRKRLPFSYYSQNRMIEQLREERHALYSQIATADRLGDIDKDFLRMNFDQLLSWGEGKDAAIESLNGQAKDFLEKYPGSRYEAFVKQYIGLEFKTTKWGLAAEYLTGCGFFTGQVGKVLSPVIPIGITFDIRYRHFALRIFDHIGFSKTKDSIRTGEITWRKNAPARVFNLGAVFGYYVIDTKKHKLFPFAGILCPSVSPPLFKPKQDHEYSGFNFTSALTFGMSLDLFLRMQNETASNWYNRDLHYFRITYTFLQPHYEKKYPGYTGAMHNLTIGYSMFSGQTRRVK